MYEFLSAVSFRDHLSLRVRLSESLLSLPFFYIKSLVVQMAQYVADVIFYVYIARKCNLRVQYLGVNEATLCFLGAARFDLYVIALKPNASILCSNTNVKLIVIFLMIVAQRDTITFTTN